jgi:peptide/nickel transport system permease protein
VTWPAANETKQAIPDFMLALVLMVIAQRFFGWSMGGLFSREYVDAPWSVAKFVDMLKHLWVPILVVGTAGTAGLMRIMRGNLLDVLNMQYVQAARARGLREPVVILKHAVRNAIHPLIMLLGLSLPAIISGSLVVSIVLGLPTTGPLYFNALRQQDMYLAGTFLMFLATMLVVGNFLADLLLAMVDPRIRYE